MKGRFTTVQSASIMPKIINLDQTWDYVNVHAKIARKKIKITFPDGNEISNKTVKLIFVDVLKKIGLDKVKALNLIEYGLLLFLKRFRLILMKMDIL